MSLNVGDPVVYTSFPGAAEERGIVTSLGRRPGIVFVRYAGQPVDADGKATPVDRLRIDDRARKVITELAEKISEAVEPHIYRHLDTVEVVTRYGGHRHYAWERTVRGERNGTDGGRHFTLCRSTSSWTLASWAETPDHPQGLTAADMAALPLCQACVDVKAAGR